MAVTNQNPPEGETPIEKAIRIAGGPTALARELKARGHDKVNSHSTVNAWEPGCVPAKYCPDIEDITGVPCEALNNETNWGLVRDRRNRSRASCAASQGAH